VARQAPNWVCFARLAGAGPRWQTAGQASRRRSFPICNRGIGFVLSRPVACTIHHNSFPARHLPFISLRCELALFRTVGPPNWVHFARWPLVPRSPGCVPPARGELGLFPEAGHQGDVAGILTTETRRACPTQAEATENETGACLAGQWRGFRFRLALRLHVSSCRSQIIDRK
jgi:hypothetical protein